MKKNIFSKLRLSLVISLSCFLLVNGDVLDNKYDEAEGLQYLKKINADIQVKTTENVLASWAYESNITDENLRHQLDVSAKLANYTKEIWKETIKYPWKTFKDPDVRRQFQKFSVLGTAILSPPKYERFNKIISDMQSIYGKAKICNYKNRTVCTMQLEPELTEIFVKSRDPAELRYYWEQWRNVAGKPVRAMYKEYVDLSNEAAALNNFTNNAEFWLKDYEAKDFKQQVENLWQQLRPLYLQLHAYVRRRLREQYGEHHVPKRGPIPAHLLGNMWAQSWGNVFDFTAPYPGKPSMDVTPSMVEQGYTPLRMFKLAEEFFTSLNLDPMPDTFWKNSILEKPTDGRDLICHASAWDFYDGKDFRIKQCTRVTFRQLVTVHHEMGHIQYYLQYKNQPKIYRRGANPGFHEAVGDVMALSVSTPKHLRKIGLLNATQDDAESEINQLFSMALDKIAFLPFGYLMDQWRWSVFEGKTNERDYNCKWWQLREKYQGLSPSGIRTEDDFDPGAKYHTVGNVPYIRYFVSFVIQFQFHRSLCIAAKEFDPNDPVSKPLHKCDIYQSKEAGALLKKMLQMGSSKPWPDAMEVMTGQRKMDARALLDYFATLQAWLEKENKRTGEFIGWDPSQKECDSERTTKTAESSDPQGNFQDDNSAYSYAELVCQDDNSFGLPDYMEEVQPSYHALQHRQKKKELKTSYFLPKSNSHIFSKGKRFYLPKGSQMQDQDDFFNTVRLQRHNNNNNNNNNLRMKYMKKVQINSLENRLKRQKENQGKLINAIFNEVQQLNSKKDRNYKVLSNKSAYKLISVRNADAKNEKNSNEIEDVKDKGNEETEEKVIGKNKHGEKLKVESDKELQKKKSSDSEIKLNENEVGKSKAFDQNTETLNEKTQPDQYKPESFTGHSFKKLVEIHNPHELMWKAELVKNEAEKMLKNYNNSPLKNLVKFEGGPLKTAASSQDTSSDSGNHEESRNKKVRNSRRLYNAPKCFTCRNHVEINKNPFKRFLKTPEFNSFKNTPIKVKKRHNFQEYDLLSIIPVHNLPAVDRNGQELGETKRNTEFPEKTYVIFVGKLSEEQLPSSIAKIRQKKSYKEYIYNLTSPAVCNAVVITSSGKNDKPDEAKDRWSKINRRNSLSDRGRISSGVHIRRESQRLVHADEEKRHRQFLKNNFKSSVKQNNLNINNIVQYFGCLQLLL